MLFDTKKLNIFIMSKPKVAANISDKTPKYVFVESWTEKSDKDTLPDALLKLVNIIYISVRLINTYTRPSKFRKVNLLSIFLLGFFDFIMTHLFCD